MKYNFKSLYDSYAVSVQHYLPDDSVVAYSAKIEVEARKINKEQYRFEFVRRYDVLLNETKPETASDLVMAEIGESLYPLCFWVSPTRQAVDIENFEEVKKRWTEKRTELLEKYRTFEFEQYLKASAHNMDNKQRFFKVLQRDDFFRFYFLPVEVQVPELTLHNFPEHGYQMMYYALLNQKESIPGHEQYQVLPAFIDGNMIQTDGTLSNKSHKAGDPKQLNLQVNLLMNDQRYFRRHISIHSNADSERIVNNWI